MPQPFSTLHRQRVTVTAVEPGGGGAAYAGFGDCGRKRYAMAPTMIRATIIPSSRYFPKAALADSSRATLSCDHRYRRSLALRCAAA